MARRGGLLLEGGRAYDRMRALRREVRERTVTEGVLGGDARWLALGALYWGAVGFRWAWKKDPEIAVHEELKPGEQLVISYGTLPSKRERRRARRRTAAAERAAQKPARKSAEKAALKAAAAGPKAAQSRSARKARAKAEAEAARRAEKRARKAAKKATRRDRRSGSPAATMDA